MFVFWSAKADLIDDDHLMINFWEIYYERESLKQTAQTLTRVDVNQDKILIKGRDFLNLV